MKKMLNKILNRETISYLIFGVLTTLVNFGVSWIFYKLLGANASVSAVIAWVAAVLFAFVTNKLFVFQSKGWKKETIASEFIKFVAARIVSLFPEVFGMWLFVDKDVFGLDAKLGNTINYWLWKIAISVLVVILNYFFSKFFIFRSKEKTEE